MENSEISWTDHTFNPWIGCAKVSPGCTHCYAEARDQRFAQGKHWGQRAPRQRTSVANWKMPLRWNKQASGEGPETLECPSCQAPWKECVCGFAQRRPRVFCASLADWLDDEVPIEWLANLLKLIHDTPNLDWLLLTKRPENWRKRLDHARDAQVTSNSEARWNALFPMRSMITKWIEQDNPPDNIWFGTTVENQEMADKRIPILLSIPAKVRFLSCEPLLGEVRLHSDQIFVGDAFEPTGEFRTHKGKRQIKLKIKPDAQRGIHWVICGGESGPRARAMHPDWARSLRDQCQAAGVPFHFKQWGAFCRGDQITNGGVQDEEAWNDMFHRVKNKDDFRELDGREWNEFPKVEVAA